MRKNLFGLLAAPVVLGLAAASIAAAAPAQAYDREAYAFAAGHMLESSDIPSSLGAFTNAMYFNAAPGSKIYACYVNSKDIVVKPKGAFLFNASFNEAPSETAAPNNLSQSVYQYASAEKAITAYQSLTKAVKGCTGTTTNTWPLDDGSTQTSTSLTTNGRVPAVTEVGVESVFVNTNYLTTSSDGKDKYASDSYTVFSLVNDVIMSTGYTTGNLQNIPTKQRKKVNQVAFDAISRWVG